MLLTRICTLFSSCSRRPNRPEAKSEEGQHAETDPYEYPIFPPPPPQEIASHRSEYIASIRARKYRVPKGVTADTPLYALYRLYEFFVVDHVTSYRNQLEFFWKRRSWAVRDIPDPKYEDPARYAFLACIPALIVSSFNERIKLGLARDTPAIISPEEAEKLRTRPESSKKYEELPEWTEHVPPLPETLFMPSHDNIVMEGFDDPRASDWFKPKNILIWGPHIHFT